jgi:hypothetical protein
MTAISEHLLAKKVLALDDYITPETAQRLYIDMTENAVFSSSMVSDQRGDLLATEDTNYTNIQTEARISETAFFHSFSPEGQKMLDDIRDLVCETLGVNADQFEPWQCTRYFVGGKFDYHDDCGNWASNERLYTVMYTVRAADVGGETHFDKLGIKVDSKFNRLLIWRNLNEEYLCDGMSRHSGCPVGGEPGLLDEKMILVTWIRRFKYVP